MLGACEPGLRRVVGRQARRDPEQRLACAPEPVWADREESLHPRPEGPPVRPAVRELPREGERPRVCLARAYEQRGHSESPEPVSAARAVESHRDAQLQLPLLGCGHVGGRLLGCRRLRRGSLLGLLVRRQRRQRGRGTGGAGIFAFAARTPPAGCGAPRGHAPLSPVPAPARSRAATSGRVPVTRAVSSARPGHGCVRAPRPARRLENGPGAARGNPLSDSRFRADGAAEAGTFRANGDDHSFEGRIRRDA